jgi:hypothetical protein
LSLIFLAEIKAIGFRMQGVCRNEVPGILKFFSYFALFPDTKNKLFLAEYKLKTGYNPIFP